MRTFKLPQLKISGINQAQLTRNRDETEFNQIFGPIVRIVCSKQIRTNDLLVRKMYQLDANNFTMILSRKWPLHVSDIYMSIFRSSYI